MNAATMRDRDCPNMCPYMFHTTSAIVDKYTKNQRKPEIAFPSGKEWNENEDGMIVSGMNEFMNFFGVSVSSGV
jgi:hypothetical protein